MTPEQWSKQLYLRYRTSGDGLKTITASLIREAVAEERARCAAKVRTLGGEGMTLLQIAAAIEGGA